MVAVTVIFTQSGSVTLRENVGVQRSFMFVSTQLSNPILGVG